MIKLGKGRLLVSAQIIRENESHRANCHLEIRKKQRNREMHGQDQLRKAEAGEARSL